MAEDETDKEKSGQQQESFYAQVKRALIDKECPFQLVPPPRFADTQPHVYIALAKHRLSLR